MSIRAREFWIHQGQSRGDDFVSTGNETRLFEGIHVIEKSGYDKAVEALKEIYSTCVDVKERMIAEDALKELGEIE